MPAGLLVNLEKIKSFSDDFNSCGSIIPLAEKCNGNLSTVQMHYKNFGENETFKVQNNKIDDIQRALNAIINNVDDLSEGLLKYYNKMSEDGVAKEDKDSYVAKNRSEFDTEFESLKNLLVEIEIIYLRVFVDHDSVKFDNFYAKASDVFDKEDREIRELSNEFASNVDSCMGNENIKHFLKEAEKSQKKLEDWYDLDFSTSDHLKMAAPVALDVIITTGVTLIVVACTAVATPEIIAAAVSAGFFSAIKMKNKSEDGATTLKTLGSGATTFGMNMVPGVVEAKYGFGGVITKYLSTDNPKVYKILNDYDINITRSKGKNNPKISIKNNNNTVVIGRVNGTGVKVTVYNNVSGAAVDVSIDMATEYLNDNNIEIEITELENSILKFLM